MERIAASGISLDLHKKKKISGERIFAYVCVSIPIIGFILFSLVPLAISFISMFFPSIWFLPVCGYVPVHFVKFPSLPPPMPDRFPFLPKRAPGGPMDAPSSAFPAARQMR